MDEHCNRREAKGEYEQDAEGGNENRLYKTVTFFRLLVPVCKSLFLLELLLLGELIVLSLFLLSVCHCSILSVIAVAFVFGGMIEDFPA